MKYPNTCKGLTKIFISESFGIVGGAVALLSLLFVSQRTSGSPAMGAISGADVTVTMMVSSFIGVAAFVIYLLGLVQARKDEEEFRMALIMLVVAIVCSLLAFVAEGADPVMEEMMEFASELFELVAFENVVSGITHFAKKYRNDGILSITQKMRVIVTIIWITVIAGKLLEFFAEDVSQIVLGVLTILETLDHVLFMIILYNGRKMLAGTGASAEG